MRSIRVVRKARCRVPGNSVQLLPISTARAMSRRCADGSGSRVDWKMPPGSRSYWRPRLVTRCSISGGNAQGGGAFALILGDQRAGDIVAVAPVLFDRIARRHPVALGIEQHPGEQGRVVSARAEVALVGMAGEPHLNRIPQRMVDDWRVF